MEKSPLFIENENIINSLIYKVEEEIFNKTRCVVKLVVNESHNSNTIHELIHFEVLRFCKFWNVNTDYLTQVTRKTEVIEMRSIIYHYLKTKYKYVTLQQIAEYFGGKDHSTVSNGIKRANKFLTTRDPLFSFYYDKIKHLYNAK